jgi:hypothetical protein
MKGIKAVAQCQRRVLQNAWGGQLGTPRLERQEEEKDKRFIYPPRGRCHSPKSDLPLAEVSLINMVAWIANAKIIQNIKKAM